MIIGLRLRAGPEVLEPGLAHLRGVPGQYM